MDIIMIMNLWGQIAAATVLDGTRRFWPNSAAVAARVSGWWPDGTVGGQNGAAVAGGLAHNAAHNSGVMTAPLLDSSNVSFWPENKIMF